MAHLYETLPSDVVAHINEIHDRYAQAWQTSPRPRIEDYLRTVHEPEYAALLFLLIQTDVQQRRACGETPCADEYERRFPNATDMMESVLSDSPASLVSPNTAMAQLVQQFAEHGYRLLEEIGRGAFGRVFRAVRESDRRVVAIKVLEPLAVDASDLMALFAREMLR